MGGGPRQAGAGEDRHRPLRHAVPLPRPGLVAGQPLASPTRSSSATTCARCSCIRWPRRRAGRSPTAAATRLSPRFDRSGKYLYFIASTSAGLSQGWLDMTSMARPGHEQRVRGGAADGRSRRPSRRRATRRATRTRPRKTAGRRTRRRPPPTRGAAKGASDKGAEGQDRRPTRRRKRSRPSRCASTSRGSTSASSPCPSTARTTAALETGAEGILFLVANPIVLTDEDYAELESVPPQNVFRFDLKKRKTEKLLEKIDGNSPVYGGLRTFVVSADGEKMLYSQGKKWSVAPVREGARRRGRRGAEGLDRGPRRSARRVASDVPRGLAPRARLPLRARTSTASTSRRWSASTRPTSKGSPAAKT